jgi:predicted nucleotidyltransferase
MLKHWGRTKSLAVDSRASGPVRDPAWRGSRFEVSDAESQPLTPEHPFVDQLRAALEAVYGDRLVAVALFGSVARRTAHLGSDLDVLVVVEQLPRGHRARLATFDEVERQLAPAIHDLERSGVPLELSPILRTPEDLRVASPLMLDMTEDAVILTDRRSVLKVALDDIRRRLQRLGSRRVWVGTRWYWDLKPDYRRGDTFEL